MKNRILELFSADPALVGLSPALVAELAAIAVVKRVQRGHFIHHKGDAPSGLLRLIEGRVKVGAATEDGEAFLLTTLVPGQWFGEISILDGKPRTHDARAQELCTYVLLPTSKVRRLSEQHSEIKALIIKLLCSHIRTAFAAIDDFLLLTPAQRLAKRVLSMMADKRAEVYKVELSQQDLSDLMGLSRQSINKILKQWEQQKLIKRVYRGFEVYSRDGLNALLSG